MKKETTRLNVTPDVYVPLGITVSIVGAAASWVATMSYWTHSNSKQIDELQSKVEIIHSIQQDVVKIRTILEFGGTHGSGSKDDGSADSGSPTTEGSGFKIDFSNLGTKTINSESDSRLQDIPGTARTL